MYNATNITMYNMYRRLFLHFADESVELNAVPPELRVPVGGGARDVRHVIRKIRIEPGVRDSLGTNSYL